MLTVLLQDPCLSQKYIAMTTIQMFSIYSPWFLSFTAGFPSQNNARATTLRSCWKGAINDNLIKLISLEMKFHSVLYCCAHTHALQGGKRWNSHKTRDADSIWLIDSSRFGNILLTAIVWIWNQRNWPQQQRKRCINQHHIGNRATSYFAYVFSAKKSATSKLRCSF